MDNTQQQIQALWDEINKLKDAGKIDIETEQAFVERLGISSKVSMGLSAHSVASETQAVNEAGIASYSVAKPMDGFRQVVLSGGTVIHIPYYS